MEKLLVFSAESNASNVISYKYYKVAEAFYPLGWLLRLLGMMPLSKHPEIGLPLLYTAKCWLTAYAIIPIVFLIAATYIGIVFYALILTNPKEKIVMIMYLISSGVFGCIIIAISAYKSKFYGSYFSTWGKLDQFMHLDQPDNYLQRFSKLLANLYFGISTFGLVSSAGIYLLRYITTDNHSPNTLLHLIPLLTWSTYNVGSFTLPDMMFLFLAKAILKRFQVIQHGLKKSLMNKNNKSRLNKKLRHYRLSYHKMLEMVDETNDVLSPTLLLDCISNGIQISLVVYGIVLPSNSSNKMWMVFKFGYGIMSFTKLAFVCFAASNVGYAAEEVGYIIKKATTIKYSDENIFELEMFLLDITKSKVEFTASGYFSISLGFLCTVIGALMTFFITIVQFNSIDVCHNSNSFANFTKKF